MEKITVEALDPDPHPLGVNRERRNVTDALGADHLAVVHYELAPGEQFSGGLHTHHDQEELFYVLEGTATFEVGTDGENVDVAAGEAIRFAPGEFQCGRNESDGDVVALALAAPGSRHNWADIESFAPCSECEAVTSHGVREPDEAFVIHCLECGTEMAVA